MNTIQDKAFAWLVVAVTLALVWILRPFYGAILWGTVIAVVFAPLHRRLRDALGRRPNAAALATVLILLVLVILPLTAITVSVVREALGVYERVQSGEINFTRYLNEIMGSMPAWVTGLLDRFSLTNFGDLQAQVLAGLARSGQSIAAQVLNIGQGTADFIVSLFVMLYLLFFLLRDGDELSRCIQGSIPLSTDRQQALSARFTAAIRSTAKCDLVVALLQGALGGLIFWFLDIRPVMLWAAVMALLSLLPVVGTGLVWLPVALYLLATGALWQGLLLVAYGVVVISSVDNILRPILIGKDTKIPDYLVLMATLGGIATFGVNGFVVGPLIAAMFMAVWDIFAASRREALGESARD
jgi:predicted PurR-regulated permease PerM